MARGKWLLTIGLLLGGGLLHLHAQQAGYPVGSSTSEGTSGWAIDRVTPPVRPNPVAAPPNGYPPTYTTQVPQVVPNPSTMPSNNSQIGQPNRMPPGRPVYPNNPPTGQGYQERPQPQPVVPYYPNYRANAGQNSLPPNRPLYLSPNDPQGSESMPSIPVTQGNRTEPPLASQPAQVMPAAVGTRDPREMVQVGYQAASLPAAPMDNAHVETLPPLPGEQLPPLDGTGSNGNHLAPTRLPARNAPSNLPSNLGVTPNPVAVEHLDPPPVPHFQPGSGAPSNQVIPVTTNTPPAMLPPPGPAVAPTATVTTTPEQPLNMDLQGSMDGFRSQYYFKAEYLLWWTKNDFVPPLVTTGPPILLGGTAPDGATLDRSDTRVLFGGDGLSQGAQSGVRLTAGWWYDHVGNEGIELSGFILPQTSTNFFASSNQYPQLSRPFTNEATGLQSAQDTTFPGLAVGNIQVHAPSELWGLEANLRCKLCCGETCEGGWRIDAIGGPRYLNLAEGISITENSQLSGNPGLASAANQTDVVNDSFATRNQFIGGQIGLDAQYFWHRWSVDVRAKLGLGYNDQSLVIQGSQTLPDQLGSREGGLLALATNIGRYGKDEFSIVPEIGVNFGYQVTDHWRATLGYNFLGWTNVLRPGEQINTTLDASLIPQFPLTPVGGHNEPSIPFKESSYWAQGLTVGLEFRY